MMLLVLPLRIPVKCDLERQLSDWIDSRSTCDGNSFFDRSQSDKRRTTATGEITNVQSHNHTKQQQEPSDALDQHIDRLDQTSQKFNASSSSINNNSRSSQMISFTSKDCSSDLRYLAQLRYRIGSILNQRGFQTAAASSSLRNGSSHSHIPSGLGGVRDNEQDFLSKSNLNKSNSMHSHRPLSSLHSPSSTIDDDLREYAAVLKDCDERGILPGCDDDDPDGIIQFSWRFRNEIINNNDLNNGSNQGRNNFTTNSTDNETDGNLDYDELLIETHSNLKWERANVVWNLATLEAYRAAEVVRGPSGGGTVTVIPRAAWAKAGQHLQNAAHLIRYLRNDIVSPLLRQMSQSSKGTASSSFSHLQHSNHSMTRDSTTNDESCTLMSQPYTTSSCLILSTFFLELWERFCTAEAQHATYETFRIAVRPKFYLLAKLAAGAAPLYQCIEDMCQSAETERLLNTCSIVEYPNNGNSDGASTIGGDFGSPPIKLDAIIMDWEDTVRAWGMWMTAVAEYHESAVHREQGEFGYELARLEAALQFGSFCKEFCESGSDSDLLDNLALQVIPTIAEMEERYEMALRENKAVHKQEIPDHDELPEVQPQLSVSTPEQDALLLEQQEQHQTQVEYDNISKHDLNHQNQVYYPESTAAALSKLLPSSNRSMFINVIADSIQRRFADEFKFDMNRIVEQNALLAVEQTEHARRSLTLMKLPHNLILYNQEQEKRLNERADNPNVSFNSLNFDDCSNIAMTTDSTFLNAIPDDLWNEIEQYQAERIYEMYEKDLSYMRQCSDDAKDMFEQMKRTLEEDIQMDALFREQNPSFRGHSVPDIQKPFHSALKNYDRLLRTARESDELLQRKYQCNVTPDESALETYNIRDWNNFQQFKFLRLSRIELNNLLSQKQPLSKASSTIVPAPKDSGNKYHPATSSVVSKCSWDGMLSLHSRSSVSRKKGSDGVDLKKDDDEDVCKGDIEIDVTVLSKSLVDLSLLFNDRESFLHTMKERVKTFNIYSEFQKVAVMSPSHAKHNFNDDRKTSEKYRQIVEDSKSMFHEMLTRKINEMTQRQQELLNVIRSSNETFLSLWEQRKSSSQHQLDEKRIHMHDDHPIGKSRNVSPSDGNHSTITTRMISSFVPSPDQHISANKSHTTVTVQSITDLLDDAKRFAQHLKDGREFYNSILPKLIALLKQIHDISLRLTKERSEFEQSQQERLLQRPDTDVTKTNSVSRRVGSDSDESPLLCSSGQSVTVTQRNDVSNNNSVSRGGRQPSSTGRSTVQANSSYRPSYDRSGGLEQSSPVSNRDFQRLSITSRDGERHGPPSMYIRDESIQSLHNSSSHNITPNRFPSTLEPVSSNNTMHYDSGNHINFNTAHNYFDRTGPSTSVTRYESDRHNSSRSAGMGISIVGGGTNGGTDRSTYDRGDYSGSVLNSVGSRTNSQGTGGGTHSSDDYFLQRGGTSTGRGYPEYYHEDNSRDRRYSVPLPMTSSNQVYDNSHPLQSSLYPQNISSPNHFSRSSIINRSDIGGEFDRGRSGVRQPPSFPSISEVRVDDEKVASLVAMDFDPEKVVAALKRHDNNFEYALNELIAG